MAQPKANRAYFTFRPTIEHYSGYTFQQRGGRVYVTFEGEEVDSITDSTLSSSGWGSADVKPLTEAHLRGLALRWLQSNAPEALQ